MNENVVQYMPSEHASYYFQQVADNVDYRRGVIR